GEVKTFTAKELLEDTTPRTLTLQDPRGATDVPLSIVATNVPSLSDTMNAVQANMVRPGEAVVVVFNQAIQASSISVRLTNEAGSESLANTVSLSSGGTVLSITPSAPVEVGFEYNLQVK